MKLFWRIFTSFLTTCMLLLAVLLLGVRLLGLTPYTVLFSSMEPAFPVGALIYIRQIPTEEIELGDAISFVLNDDLVVATHRVVGVDPEAMHFITKGDANSSVDGAPVHFNNVLGKVVFSVPYLGYLANFITSSQGRYLAIALVLLLLLLLILPDLFAADKQTEQAASDEQNTDPEDTKQAKRAPSLVGQGFNHRTDKR